MRDAVAKAHIDDLLRAAEHERLARQVRKVEARRGVVRRVAGGLVAALMWPIRH